MAAKARPDTTDRKQQSNEEAAMTDAINPTHYTRGAVECIDAWATEHGIYLPHTEDSEYMRMKIEFGEAA